jgi:hypothetical protein
MAALVDLVNHSGDIAAHHAGNDLVLDISQTNGSHETIVLDHQWAAFNQASNGHFVV